MKIAIPRYGERISPRFGFTQDILVIDLDEGGIRSREVLSVEGLLPHEIPDRLSEKGVKVVLTGGINLQFQNLFGVHGIEVFWGLIGTPEEALDALLTGELTPGMGRCRFRRGRHRHRGGPFLG